VAYQNRNNEMDRACDTYEERKGAYRVLVGIPERKRSLGKPTHRWEDNIKMNLEAVGCGIVDWIDLA
jgi:hypothetical protein